MTTETHLNHRLLEFMCTRLYRYAYIFYIYYVYIYVHLYKINAPSPLFCNLEFVKTYLEHYYSNEYQVSELQRWMVANPPPSLENKTMHLLYTCCKQATFEALNPQTKPPHLQQHSAIGNLCIFWGSQMEGEVSRRSS